MPTVHTLQNEYWQAGVLPETGASLAFGRIQQGGVWHDVLRPTPEASTGNSSACSSFVMLPWCNRIKGGVLRFSGQEYALRTAKDDGTARHGDVRGRAWNVEIAEAARIRLTFRSSNYADLNWPFPFSARLDYTLNGREFIWSLMLKNESDHPAPAGFGHHPYFVRPAGEEVEIQIPCGEYFPLTNFMATGEPQPIPPDLDFRKPRDLDERELNHLLTGRTIPQPAKIAYPVRRIRLAFHSAPVFPHWLIFAPQGEPFVALEPMSNASDGFNLLADGHEGSGVFVLQPGEEKMGMVRLVLESEG